MSLVRVHSHTLESIMIIHSLPARIMKMSNSMKEVKIHVLSSPKVVLEDKVTGCIRRGM